MSDPAALRSEFPVLERLSYLNAGTNGPIPRRATEATRDSLVKQTNEGRGGGPFFEATMEAAERLRERVAAVLGCEPAELALTGSTTDGVNTVLSGSSWARATRCSPATRSTLACSRRWPGNATAAG